MSNKLYIYITYWMTCTEVCCTYTVRCTVLNTETNHWCLHCNTSTVTLVLDSIGRVIVCMESHCGTGLWSVPIGTLEYMNNSILGWKKICDVQRFSTLLYWKVVVRPELARGEILQEDLLGQLSLRQWYICLFSCCVHFDSFALYAASCSLTASLRQQLYAISQNHPVSCYLHFDSFTQSAAISTLTASLWTLLHWVSCCQINSAICWMQLHKVSFWICSLIALINKLIFVLWKDQSLCQLRLASCLKAEWDRTGSWSMRAPAWLPGRPSWQSDPWRFCD